MTFCWVELQFDPAGVATRITLLITDRDLKPKHPPLISDIKYAEEVALKIDSLLAQEEYTMLVREQDERYHQCDVLFHRRPNEVKLISEWHTFSPLAMKREEDIVTYVSRLKKKEDRWWDWKDSLILILVALLTASLLNQ